MSVDSDSTFAVPAQIPTERDDSAVSYTDPLTLKMDDKELIRVSEKVEEDWRTFLAQHKIPERSAKNFDYVRGKQWDANELQTYNARYTDNVVYEILKIINAYVFSKLPEVTFLPGNQSEQAKQDAKGLTIAINADIKEDDAKDALDKSFKSVPINYLGAIKVVWNPEVGKSGDYEYIFVPIKNLIFDSNVNSLDIRKHSIIGHKTKMTVKEMIMRFPKKKKQILKAMYIPEEDAKKELKLATMGDLVEYHYTWYEAADDGKWKKIDGVFWKIKKVVLDNIKDPNYDWEGEERIFSYDIEKMDHQPAKPKEMEDALLHSMPQGATPLNSPNLQLQNPLSANTNLKKEKVYHNFFDSPRKPFILIGIDQFGEILFDETSFIEQNLQLQDNVNVRGRQITDMANKTRGKYFLSTDAGIKKKDFEVLDLGDPTQDLMVDGNPNEMINFVPGEQPSSALFQDQSINRERMFQKAGISQNSRGIPGSKSQAAQHAQLMQGSDQIQYDYIIERTVNRAVREMAEWGAQMIKLRYTEDHFLNIFGPEGDAVFQRINRDMVHDGLKAVVSVAGGSKMNKKQEAFTKAKMKMTDPLSFFEDTDTSNPKEHAERLVLFGNKESLPLYVEKYIKGSQDAGQMSDRLKGVMNAAGPGQPPAGQPPAGPQGQDNGTQEAMMAIAMIQKGQPAPPPKQLTPGYIQTIMQFLKSPEFQNAQGPVKDAGAHLALLLQQMIQGQMGGQQAGGATQGAPGPQGQPMGGVNGPPPTA